MVSMFVYAGASVCVGGGGGGVSARTRFNRISSTDKILHVINTFNYYKRKEQS